MGARKGLLLMDASVLIDLCEVDSTVIPLVSDQIGIVHVPTPVLLEEVERVRREDWTALGIVAVEPPLETALLAAQRQPGLSFYDQLCLLLARDNRWTCVTSDARLRRECDVRDIPALLGVDLIALLVEGSVLTEGAGVELGGALRRANPAFIRGDAFDRFKQRISGLRRSAQRESK